LVALAAILAGGNRRNLPAMLALVLLISAHLLAHLEALGRADPAQLGARLGIATVVMLTGLIGGRIIPSFTRNWLTRRGETALPAPFAGFDKLCLAATLAALAGWVLAESHPGTGAALIVAGGLNLVRLARWQGRRTLSEPLVWSLHLGFLWIPLGLLVLGLGLLAPEILAPTAGLHALTAGAIGGMTLAVMTRATLGHSGRALTADRWTAAAYLFVAAAAVLRVIASMFPETHALLLGSSGALWTTAFAIFLLRFGRIYLSA